MNRIKHGLQEALRWLAEQGGVLTLDSAGRMWGRCRIEAYRPGEDTPFFVDDGDNIVIKDGKVFALRLLGSVAGALAIDRMKVGDGGCGVAPFPVGNQLFNPLPFSVTDTDLRHQLAFTGGPYQLIEPAPPVDSGAQTITFTSVFDSSLVLPASFGYTPNVVNETALVSGDGQIMALRAHKSVPFDQGASIKLRAVWAIGIT